MFITLQCFEDFLLEGGGGSRNNGHRFPFLDNIELYKHSLIELPLYNPPHQHFFHLQTKVIGPSFCTNLKGTDAKSLQAITNM